MINKQAITVFIESLDDVATVKLFDE